MEELDPYLDFIKYVKAHMEHPEWLGEFTREDYVWMLNNGSHIVSIKEGVKPEKKKDTTPDDNWNYSPLIEDYLPDGYISSNKILISPELSSLSL